MYLNQTKTHNLCKEIYENIIDKDVTRKCGIKLNAHGGFNTMADAYEILSWCSPLTSTPFKVLLADVKVSWNEIGEWKLI